MRDILISIKVESFDFFYNMVSKDNEIIIYYLLFIK